jgi:hypothetical protein
MPRYSSNPILLDHALSLSLKDLKGLGYLREHHSVSGVVNWNRHGQVIGSASVAVDLAFKQTLELSYRSSGMDHRQVFRLISKPSNLSKGRYWLIQSLESGKLGRKVYLTGSGFQLRADATGCIYENQTQSKYYRSLDHLLMMECGVEIAQMEFYRKGYRKYYAGKPTKRYKKLGGSPNQAERLERNSLTDIFNGLRASAVEIPPLPPIRDKVNG